jgi:hypothetical protein
LLIADGWILLLPEGPIGPCLAFGRSFQGERALMVLYRVLRVRVGVRVRVRVRVRDKG